jgi:hypothetical protein
VITGEAPSPVYLHLGAAVIHKISGILPVLGHFTHQTPKSLTEGLEMVLRFACLSLVVSLCLAHSVHHHGQHSARGEREEDGAFSPRDNGHFSEDGGHHGEFDHEAILGIIFCCVCVREGQIKNVKIIAGSTKTAEEFDSLPPEEARRRLKILLSKMDRNRDGQIERQELHSWILRSFRLI